MVSNYLDKLTAFIGRTEYSVIPVGARKRAQLIIADCVAAIVGGMAEPEIELLFTSMSGSVPAPEAAPTSAQILGTQHRIDAINAALINGTAGTALEMDEGHQFARGHPGMHVFPALLSAAQVKPVSDEAFLTAFIVGYDIAARIGIATALNGNMHPHGTWGGLGAAAALASLYQLDAAQIKTYLNIVSSLSLATSRQTMLEGGTVRNVYTGVSNQMAHIGYQLLQAGFSGEADGIKSVFGGVVSSSFDQEKACELIGTRFEVTRNYFKLHACCRYNHAALDALWQLMGAHSALADITMISAIDVSSYCLAAELVDPAPQNVLAGKFSIPFAIATTLVNRSSKVHSFTSDAVANPTILALARKVTVREDPAMSAKLPDLRPATVTITLADGDVLEASVETNRGDWQDPYTPAQIKEKYLSLTTRIWSDEKAEDVFAAIMNMDNATAPSTFIERL